MNYRYYIGKALDAEDNPARDSYLNITRSEAYNIEDPKEREKALKEIESLRR